MKDVMSIFDSQTYARDIVYALPHPALMLDSGLSIVAANAQAEHLFDHILVGSKVTAALPETEIISMLDSVQSSGTKDDCRLSLNLRTTRTYLAAAGPVRTADGGASNILLTLTDISAEIDAEKSRSTFVANVSHELRSPLTSLMGVVETLQGPARDDVEARDRFLTLMQGETERMSRLVGDLLSLAKLESKEHVQPEGQVDIAVTLRRIIAVLSEGTAGYKDRVTLELDEAIPAVRGNEDELTEVFQNLIENALKYSDSNTPVEVNASARSGQLVVNVVDYGEGISQKHLPRLTERFYRVDKGRSREKGGTGLGLAISKHIINRHRGALDIQSEVGKGTTMTVSLRLPSTPNGEIT